MIQARIFVAKIPFSIKKTQFVGTEMAQWLPHHTFSNLTELGFKVVGSIPPEHGHNFFSYFVKIFKTEKG